MDGPRIFPDEGPAERQNRIQLVGILLQLETGDKGSRGSETDHGGRLARVRGIFPPRRVKGILQITPSETFHTV